MNKKVVIVINEDDAETLKQALCLASEATEAKSKKDAFDELYRKLNDKLNLMRSIWL